jgi:ElaB/YqjD/DUF883 family membrane-anchored ribosome-binding protein
MNQENQAASHDAGTLAKDARAPMAATADGDGVEASDGGQRLAAIVESGNEIYGQLRAKTVAGAKTADEAVPAHAYQDLGIALGVGAIIDHLLARRGSQNCG